MRVLVLNAGSSSLKGSLLDRAGTVTIARAERDLGSDATAASADMEDAVRRIVTELTAKSRPEAVGHRVVHGGSRFREPVLVDDGVLDGIEALAAFAPLHNPVAARVIRHARALLPGLPQVAIFDTAFHATLEPAAFRYALPTAWYTDWQVRRYGFHGISVNWSVERASALLQRPVAELRLLVAHLGSGCSVTAVDRGRSVATTMGLTPLEGLVMGTRAGSIDPGILFFILRTNRLDADALEQALDHDAGLRALAGTTDVRLLEAQAGRGDDDARLALDLFERQAAAGIAGMATALPMVDALVFTGGIGEHAARLRQAIVGRLAAASFPPIVDTPVDQDALLSTGGAAPAILRIEAREDAMIARGVEQLAASSVR